MTAVSQRPALRASSCSAPLRSHGSPASPGRHGGLRVAGRHLLAGQWSAVYADPWNQAGPVQLVLSALLLPGGRTAPPSVVIALVNLALMGLVVVATRRRDVRVEFGAAGFALVWLALPTFWSGHPIEMLIPLLWLAGLDCARRRATLRAAALFAATVAIAPWAILAIPALLAVCRPALAVRTGVLAVGGAARLLPAVRGVRDVPHVRPRLARGALDAGAPPRPGRRDIGMGAAARAGELRGRCVRGHGVDGARATSARGKPPCSSRWSAASRPTRWGWTTTGRRQQSF